jgi:hypothetical protein
MREEVETPGSMLGFAMMEPIMLPVFVNAVA